MFTPLIALLAIGVLSIVLSRTARLSPIVGYVVAGVAIGPHGFHLLEHNEATHLLAELGVVFLLFDIGLHFSLKHLWEMRTRVAGLGALQMGIVAAILAGVCTGFGLWGPVTVLVAISLALSSTAVVVQTLRERGNQDSPIGRSATSVLIFQDIVAMLLLIALAGTSAGGAQADATGVIGIAVAKAAGVFVVALLLARFVVRPLFRVIAGTRNEEIFTALTLLMVFAAATATAGLGLSLTLGAFLAGMIVAETDFRAVVQMEVKPFRGLLLGFFFINVGMSLEAGLVLREWPTVLAVLSALLLAKTLGAFLAGKAFGMPTACAINFGMLMSQGSEFAFVVFGTDVARDALGPTATGALLAAVTASLALTPFLADAGRSWGRRISERQRQATAEAAHETRSPIVILGMNEVGRTVADAMEDHAIPYLAVEPDYEGFVRAQGAGYAVAFGDLADIRLAEVLGMDRRPMLVVARPRYEVASSLTPIVRERFPQLERVAAVPTEEDAKRFAELGMSTVVNRGVPRGIELAELVLRRHGIEDERLAGWVRDKQAATLDKIAS